MKKFCLIVLFLSAAFAAMQNQPYEEYQNNRKKLFSGSRIKPKSIDDRLPSQSIMIVKFMIPIPQAQSDRTISGERAYLSSITKAIKASRNIYTFMRTIERNSFLEQFDKTFANLEGEEQRRDEIMLNPTFVSQTIQSLVNITEALKDSFFTSPQLIL
ncbi:MAG: hypothetical protein ACK4V2_00495 [Pseudomonadota bacterium]|jgi:hypothetical protein|nr:hypothetical protein [Alphaproteobacteria bacterium]